MNKNKKIYSIAIHGGAYHYDELLAVAICGEQLHIIGDMVVAPDSDFLRITGGDGEMRITRIPRTYAGDFAEFDLVLDVGMRSGDGKFYDHHQDGSLPCAARQVSEAFGFPETQTVLLVDEQDRTGKLNIRSCGDIRVDFLYIRQLWLTELAQARLQQQVEARIDGLIADFPDSPEEIVRGEVIDLTLLGQLTPQEERAALTIADNRGFDRALVMQGANVKHIALLKSDGSQAIFSGEFIAKYRDKISFSHPNRFMLVAGTKLI